jgi:hypothetical protein
MEGIRMVEMAGALGSLGAEKSEVKWVVTKARLVVPKSVVVERLEGAVRVIE